MRTGDKEGREVSNSASLTNSDSSKKNTFDLFSCFPCLKVQPVCDVNMESKIKQQEDLRMILLVELLSL